MTPSDPQLILESLGGISATVRTSDGIEGRLERNKATALLIYLASVPGNRASRERLVTLFFAKSDPEHGLGSLRTMLVLIRQGLGERVLHSTREEVALNCAFELDRDVFWRSADRGEFEAAVTAYHGEFMSEFASPGADEFEKWADGE